MGRGAVAVSSGLVGANMSDTAETVALVSENRVKDVSRGLAMGFGRSNQMNING